MPTRPSRDTTPRVLGVLIARNEWPLLGICITHALTNHVDEIIVVDHASTDDTQAGLAELQMRWGNKIQVLHLCEGTFHHEETNLMLKTMYEDLEFDWVYPIDADEFLITPNNVPLKQLLAEVPDSYEAVRYEIHNFVAPADFVEKDFHRYSELREKAVINPNFQITHGDFVESIVQGGLNFFEVPFDPKVMFRLPQLFWTVGGSHSLLGVGPESEFKFPEENTFVAHLPFLTRERLVRRAERGKTLVNTGYSRDHGWQSQVVNQMHEQGRLDEYWINNSISVNESDSKHTSPSTMSDIRLAPILEDAIAGLVPLLSGIMLNSTNIKPKCEPELSISLGIQGIRAMALHRQQGIDSANLQLKNVRNEIADLHASASWRWTRTLRLIDKSINGWLSKSRK